MPYEQAHKYLARVIAWPKAGEPPAYVNVHWTFVPKGGLKPGQQKLPWTGRATRSIEEAVRTVAWAASLTDTRDMYVCLSTQREAQETESKSKRKYLKPVRLAENAVTLKCFFLDIDGYKDGPTGYPTIEGATDALVKFIQDAGLPKPNVVVMSGGGLHVYWTVARALTPHEWYPLACALIEATKRHGLKCDAQVTTDAARVLRVPETFNHKTSPARPVRILGAVNDVDYPVETIEKALAPYKVAATFLANDKSTAFAFIENPSLFPRRAAIVGHSDLSAGIETAMPREQVGKCLDAIPNNRVDWNFWNSVGMRVFAATEGAEYGLEEWQRWTNTNKAVANATDNCADRWNTLHSSPPSRTGAGALVNQAREALKDPHWLPYVVVVGGALPQQVTSTTTPQGAGGFGPTGNLQQAVSSDLPNGYIRDPHGLIMVHETGDGGASALEPVSDYQMTDAWLQKAPWIIHFTTVTERGRKQQVSLEVEFLGTNEMRKLLQSQGFMLRNPKRMADFLMSWVKKLQETKDAVQSSPFGWSVKGGHVEGFVYGGKMHTPKGISAAADPDPEIARQYQPTGELKYWVDAAKMITCQGRSDLDAIIATAFAAPLVRFTGQSGLLMSTYSMESGIGKTTALKVAQSVWGDPIRATQMLTDTENSVMNKVGEIRALPMYWDELKTEDETRKFVNVAFRLSLGKEKSRMTQSIRQRTPGTWQTILVSASNDSLLQYIMDRTSTTTAGLYRCFEFEVQKSKVTQNDSSDVQRMISKLHDNYGCAGNKYAEFLGQNYTMIDKEVGEFARKLNTTMKAEPDERFWTALVTCVVLGAKYSNKLGLTAFDEKKLTRFMLDKLTGMRTERTTQTVDMRDAGNVSNQLAQFLKAMQGRHTLYTNRIHLHGKPTPGAITVERPADRLDGVHVQIGLSDGLIRISAAHLRKWLHDMKLPPNNFLKALVSEFGARDTNGRLGSGTQYSVATERIYELQVSGTAIAKFFED